MWSGKSSHHGDGHHKVFRSSQQRTGGEFSSAVAASHWRFLQEHSDRTAAILVPKPGRHAKGAPGTRFATGSNATRGTAGTSTTSTKSTDAHAPVRWWSSEPAASNESTIANVAWTHVQRQRRELAVTGHTSWDTRHDSIAPRHGWRGRHSRTERWKA